MRHSLRLIAERLCRRGYRALAINDRGVYCDKVRIWAQEDASFGSDALCVCDRLPGHSGLDAAPCAFAVLERPQRDVRVPYLYVEGAKDVVELLNAVNAVKDSLDAVLAQMGEAVWEEDGLYRITELLSQAVGNPVYIVDSSFKVLAITRDADMEEMSVNWMNAAKRGYLSYDLIANLIRSNELHDIESSRRAIVVHSGYFYTPFANYNLRLAGKVQGHLFVVQMYRSITPGDLELVDVAAAFVLRALQINPSFQAHRGPLYEHFVVDWIEGGLADQSHVRRQLDALSFDLTACSVVAILRLSVAGDFRREHLARLLEDRQGCRSVSHDGNVVALFQLKHRSEKDDVVRKVERICKSQGCCACVSDVQDSIFDTPRAYRQAREAFRICDAMNIDKTVVCYGDVAAYQPYLNFASAEDLDAFCHPAVITLRDYDESHAVKLLPTLSAYLKNDRDVQVTAAELYVHRNTLSYRLKRIAEIAPVDLDDFSTRHRVLESILVVENYEGITAHFI